MRSKHRAVIGIFMVFTMLSSVSQAATKTGTSCTKLGTTVIVSGKKYTCIKSGKKMVWDKGVSLPTPIKSNNPTELTKPKNPVVLNFGGLALSESTANINLEATGFESYELSALTLSDNRISYSSGLKNGSSRSYGWLISGLNCGTKYQVKLILWSEPDGKGTKTEVTADHYSGCFTCRVGKNGFKVI